MRIHTYRRLTFCAITICLLAFYALSGADAGLRQTPAQTLSEQAYAILKQNCMGCHGAAKTSGLDLRTAEGVLAGGENGKTIAPADPQSSRLYQFITHQEKPTMPPGKKLSEAQIETLRRWIEAGAPLEAFEKVAGGVAKSEAAKLPEPSFTAEERGFWAFQPPKRTTPPRASLPSWNRNPIDAFLYAAMKAKGLKPAPRTDRRTLIRRAYLDLTGLPPAPEEVEDFVKDKAPDAYAKLVDRLLASPHYGERWARHWLDLVRYADSGGFEFDVDRPDAWRYRDYVVKAFNDDKPYDQFIREQLAGDEYAPNSQEVSQEAMIATGFLRLGPEGGGGGERGRQDALDDLITTTTLAFMGLTVGCARCHDHKFDPIPQKDFYRIQAVFAPTRPVSYPLVSAEAVAAHKAETQRVENLQKPLKKAKDELEAPYLKILVEEAISRLPEYMQIAWRTPAEQRTPGQRLNVQQIKKTLEDDPLSQKLTEKDIVARMSADDKRKHQELVEQIRALEKQKPKPYPTARAIGEASAKPGPTYFLHRGAPDAKGPVVTPGVLSVINETDYEFPAPPPNAKSSFRRRGLAEWLVSRQNPLTARVMVNRLWQHHFGAGLAPTPSNFGKLGEAPTHPELLDWLAVELMDGATGRRGDGAKDNPQSAIRNHVAGASSRCIS